MSAQTALFLVGCFAGAFLLCVGWTIYDRHRDRREYRRMLVMLERKARADALWDSGDIAGSLRELLSR